MKADLTAADLRPYDGVWISRNEMLNKAFAFKGSPDLPKGTFKVKNIVDDNMYQCLRLTGGGETERGQLEDFDIGHVIQRYERERQVMREKGRGQVLLSRRRRKCRL